MKKQVFLLADIGLDEYNSFHVGDEAMFFCNLNKYVKNNYKVVASSRSISHKSDKFTEVLDIYIVNRLFFIWLLFCAVIFKHSRINIFPRRFEPTLRVLVESDLLHISGGGNINSFWPGHIYYRCMMIYLASLFGIPIIMTSQTIGPLNYKFHKKVLGWALNKVKFIGLRDNEFSKSCLKELVITKPFVDLTIDDASRMNIENFSGNNQLDAILKKIKDQINVGLSLHAWQEAPDPKWIAEGLTIISKKYPNAKFFAIPHLIDERDGCDTNFMNKLLKDSSIKGFQIFSHKDMLEISNSSEFIPSLVSYITSKMDIVISSRYHGLVFSCASSVPAIAINYDKYYKAKNEGLLNLYYDEPFNVDPDSDFLNIFSNVLLNKDNIKGSLIQQNIVLSQNNQYRLDQLLNRFIK